MAYVYGLYMGVIRTTYDTRGQMKIPNNWDQRGGQTNTSRIAGKRTMNEDVFLHKVGNVPANIVC